MHPLQVRQFLKDVDWTWEPQAPLVRDFAREPLPGQIRGPKAIC